MTLPNHNAMQHDVSIDGPDVLYGPITGDLMLSIDEHTCDIVGLLLGAHVYLTRDQLVEMKSEGYVKDLEIDALERR